MSQFKKTFTMNVVGACGIIATGVVLLLNKISAVTEGALWAIVAIYVLVALVPTGSARALMDGASAGLRRGMYWTNWTVVALGCLGLLSNHVITHEVITPAEIGMSLLVFVIPQAFNIRALRALLQGSSQPSPLLEPPNFRIVWGLAILCTGILAIGGGLIPALGQRQQAVQAVTSIQQEMTRLKEASTDTNGFPLRIERSTPPSQSADGEIGEAERFMKEFMDRMVALRNDYLLELDAIGWDAVLDPKRLREDVAFHESRVLLERGKAIMDKYERKTATLLADIPNQIQSLHLSEATRRQMLAGFEKGMNASGVKPIDEQWALERQAFRQIENIILMLAANKTWRIEGDQLVFTSDSDVERYNAYLQSIHDLTQRQAQLQQTSFAKALKRMEDAKQVLAR